MILVAGTAPWDGYLDMTPRQLALATSMSAVGTPPPPRRPNTLLRALRAFGQWILRHLGSR